MQTTLTTKKVNIAIFEECKILLSYLSVAFRRNKSFNLIGSYYDEETLMTGIKGKNIDTIIFGHQGVVKVKTVLRIQKLYPTIKVIGMYFNESVFKNTLLIEEEPTKEDLYVSIYKYLKPYETVNFM